MAVVSQPQPSSSVQADIEANVPHDWPEAGDLSVPAAGPRVADDDMASDPAELARWFPEQSTSELAALLEGLRTPQVDYRGKPSTLDDVYRLWDAEAQRQQVHYLWLVRVSGIAAFLAVLLAIIQLPQLEWERYGFANWGPVRGLIDVLGVNDLQGLFGLGELICGVLVVVAVVTGLRAAFSHRWQLRRLQAEQCRFLKFGYLLRCAHSLDEAATFLTDGIRRLVDLDVAYLSEPHRLAKRWVRGEVKLTPMPRTQSVTLSDQTADRIIDYYLRTRLRFQAAYFHRQAHRREFREKLLWWLPVTAFVASLVLIFAHAAIEHLAPLADQAPANASGVVEHASGEPTADPHAPPAATVGHHNTWALLCLIGAAGLPALAAWIRTYRGALEFARNANRFHGMWIQLYDAERELLRRKDQRDLPGQFEVMRDVEVALESEHRAWIRLMVEAEWFG